MIRDLLCDIYMHIFSMIGFDKTWIGFIFIEPDYNTCIKAELKGCFRHTSKKSKLQQNRKEKTIWYKQGTSITTNLPPEKNNLEWTFPVYHRFVIGQRKLLLKSVTWNTWTNFYPCINCYEIFHFFQMKQPNQCIVATVMLWPCILQFSCSK